MKFITKIKLIACVHGHRIPMHYGLWAVKEKLFSLWKFPHSFRYVDDTFTLVLSNTDFFSLLYSVNLIDPCIQFNFEVESDNSLSFLDVLVSRQIDRFLMTVFRKSFLASFPRCAVSNYPT